MDFRTSNLAIQQHAPFNERVATITIMLQTFYVLANEAAPEVPTHTQNSAKTVVLPVAGRGR